MTAGRRNTTENKDWCTPKIYVDAITAFFGGSIGLDPCSNEYSIVHAQNEYSLPKDGLKESWDSETVYVNPPYGRDAQSGTSIKHWLGRCAEVGSRGSEVIALVPVATNTRHWKDNIWGKATAVCFLFDTRLKFLERGRDGGKGAPMSCALIYWGPEYARFFDKFNTFGAVVDLRPLIHGEKGLMSV